MRIGVICVAFALAAGTVQADVLFDFEGESSTYLAGAPTGSLTALTITESGLSVDISRTGGAGFDIVENIGGQAGKPASWGSFSLSPFFNQTTNDGFVFDFSQRLTMFSIETGDYGQDTDEVVLTAYDGADGTGAVVDVVNANWDSGFPLLLTLTGSGDIQSVVMTGGSASFPSSMFYDNIRATVIPAPGAALLAMMGLPAVGWVKRRFA